jgi:hypothetical protein
MKYLTSFDNEADVETETWPDPAAGGGGGAPDTELQLRPGYSLTEESKSVRLRISSLKLSKQYPL